MKAIVWTAFGPPDVLQLQKVEKPTPKDNELLIRIRATTVSTGDCEMRSMRLATWLQLPMRLYVGFRKPKRITILGSYLAGDIEAIGKDVVRFAVGDAVFGCTDLKFGTYAEYVCLAENATLVTKPANLTYEEAAAVALGGLESLHFLSKANIQPGQTVLINGAGGSIGTYGVQLAKHFGAEVTAVDSADKLDMLRAIGANHVVDYTREDFSKKGLKYDVILDVVLKSSFSRIIASLNLNGVYLLTNPTLLKMARGVWVSRSAGRKVISAATSPNAADLTVLKELIEAGKIKTVIDRCYPLEEIVEAHQYVDTGRKKGNVVITVDHHSRQHSQ